MANTFLFLILLMQVITLIPLSGSGCVERSISLRETAICLQSSAGCETVFVRVLTVREELELQKERGARPPLVLKQALLEL